MTRTRSPLRLAGACAIALSLLTAATAEARLGDPDPGFGGGDGVAVLDSLTGAGLNAAAIRPDGKIVVAGHAIGPGPENQPWYTVARLSATGELDPSFGGGDGIVQWQGSELADLLDLALEPDGDILVSGAQSPGSLADAPSPQLARVAADGGSVAVITPETLPTIQVALNAVAPLADGRIAVAGWGWPSNTAGQPRQLVVGLLSSSGVPDTSFSTDGWDLRRFADDAQALELIVDAGGRIVVSGFAGTTLAGTEIAATLRYELDGTLDETFSDDGQLLVDYPGTFAGASRFGDLAERAGELLAAGRLAGGTQGVLQRITAAGVLAPGFGTTGAPNGAAVWLGQGEAVALTSTGGAVVAGRTASDALQAAWLTPSGTPDPAAGGLSSFGIDLFADAPPLGAAIGPGDALVVAGTNAAGAAFVARFAPNAAPAAALSAPAELLAGAPAAITAAGSSDPEGEALRYAFDLDGDGSYEFDGGENPLALRSFPAAGTFTVGVRVSDPRGGAATVQRQIAVAAGPPVPQPQLGKQGVARVVSGKVRYRLPGQKKFRTMTDV